MKLEIGMYVRTKYGEIAKLKKSRFKDLIYETDIEIDRNNDRDCNDYGFDENTIKDIIKASHNIIDLIEVGDYVNGYQVVEKPYIYQNIEFVSVDTQDSWSWGKGEMPCTEIKTILTKEQFENCSYKVGVGNEQR